MITFINEPKVSPIQRGGAVRSARRAHIPVYRIRNPQVGGSNPSLAINNEVLLRFP